LATPHQVARAVELIQFSPPGKGLSLRPTRDRYRP